MRAELDASLCIPQDHPIDLTIDPVGLSARLSDLNPKLTVAPLELDLPTVTTSLPNLTVTLPKPKVSIRAGLGLDADAIFDWIHRWMAEVNSTVAAQLAQVPPPFPLPVPSLAEVLVFWPSFGIAFPAGVVLLTPQVQIDIEVDLGQVEVAFSDPLQVDFGNVELHSVTPSSTHQPMVAAVEVPSIGLDASLGPLHIELDGCVVLNGGDERCCGKNGVRPHGAVPVIRSAVLQPLEAPDKEAPGVPRRGAQLTIVGDGFGARRDSGSVRLKGVAGAGTHTPLEYDSWSDSHITALFHQLPSGAYTVLATAADGQHAEPAPVTST